MMGELRRKIQNFPSESSPIQDYHFPMLRYLLALLATLTLVGHA